MTFTIRIGTRGSTLSLKQTYEVIDLLKDKFGHINYEINIIKSKGDIDKTTPLYKIGEKGIFEREINKALLNGHVDLAIHSAKDVPSELPEELYLAAVPPRKSAFDVLIAKGNLDLQDLPRGSRVGTSSIRRMTFIKYLRRDLEVVPIRGNVDTRIKKLNEGVIDAIIVAEVGIQRLNIDIKYAVLDPNIFVPAAGQGALMVFCLASNKEIIDICKRIDDYKSRISILVEKDIIKNLGAGCKTPLGVYAHFIDDDIIEITLATISRDLETYVNVTHRQKIVCFDDIQNAVTNVISKFDSRNGREILNEWKGCLKLNE